MSIQSCDAMLHPMPMLDRRSPTGSGVSIARNGSTSMRRPVTFTGTRSLRNAFHRLGLVPIEVGTACAESVSPADRSAWGRYYDDGPRVFVGSVRPGSRLLDTRASLEPVEACE